MKLRSGDKCPRCLRPITLDVLSNKRRIKIENALASVQKAKANGTRVGPKRRRPSERIKELRKNGLTIRAIAREIGMSTRSVQAGLEDVE